MRKCGQPRALVASGADQVDCWNISHLPAGVRDICFCFCLFVDLLSRRIVGWQVFYCERQGNGRAERMNRTIKKATIKAFH